MATELRKLVQAVGAYLRYEQLCRRTELFEEAYLTQPIGHFLMARYSGLVRAEYPHAVLTATKKGPGRRPAVDYVVLDSKTRKPSIAVEAKWLSNAGDILEQVLRDLVRLELLVNEYQCQGYFLLAGIRSRASALFAKAVFQAHPKHPNSLKLLPLRIGDRRIIRIERPSKYRTAFVKRALRPLVGVTIASRIRVVSGGMYPDDVLQKQVCAYGWRLEPSRDERFVLPEA